MDPFFKAYESTDCLSDCGQAQQAMCQLCFTSQTSLYAPFKIIFHYDPIEKKKKKKSKVTIFNLHFPAHDNNKNENTIPCQLVLNKLDTTAAR